MKRTILLLVALLAVASCAQTPKKVDFRLKRGANVSHWLSQSRLDSARRVTYFTEADVARFAEQGFDHLRLPIDEVTMWDRDHNKISASWGFLRNALDWCVKYNLRCIVDLHLLRSHSFIVAPGSKNPLFSEPEAQEWLAEMWRQLSAELKDYPLELVAYEFMNEPVADDPEDWNRLIEKIHGVIRAQEPRRVLVIGSNHQQSVFTFGDLRVPEGDPNLILSFHFYHPMLLTHHKASWTEYRNYTGTVHYPGEMVTPEEFAALDDYSKSVVGDFTSLWDRAKLQSMMQEAIDKAAEFGLPLFCGEWGCINLAPRPDVERWYRDMISLFDEFDIAWTIWDIKAEFGYWNPDGTIDPDFLALLMSGKDIDGHTPMDKYMPDLKVGSKIPALSLPSSEGGEISLKDFRGQWLVLDFWASWCPDCREEFDAVKQLQADFAPKGVAFLGVSFDHDGAAWKECLAAQQFPWPQVSNLIRWKENPVSEAFGIHWIPTMMLVDPQGKVTGAALTAEQMRKLLDRI